MKKLYVFLCSAVLIISALTGCSKSDLPDFQTNEPDPPFNIFHLFDGYPALKAAWDSVPGTTGNQVLADMMRDDIPGTSEFLSILGYLLSSANSPGLGLLDNLKGTLSLMIDPSERFYVNNNIKTFYSDPELGGSPEDHLQNFYAFLDEITRNAGGGTPKVGSSVIGILNKVLPYLLLKNDQEIQDFMEELYMPAFYTDKNYGETGSTVKLKEGNYSNAAAIGLLDDSISSIKVPSGYKVTMYQNTGYGGTSWVCDSDKADLTGCGLGDISSLKIVKDNTNFTDLAKLVATPMVLGDYPMWINLNGSPLDAGNDTLITNYGDMPGGVNSNLGNMAKGMHSLMYGVFKLLNGETVDRLSMYDTIDKLNGLLDSAEDKEIIKRLIWNMSNFFTAGTGSAAYGTAVNTSNTDINQNIYNTDNPDNLFSNSELRETLRELLTLSGGLFQRDDRYSSMVYPSMGAASQDYPLTNVIKHIDDIYINWDQTQLKESIYDLIRYDAYGRDRRTSSAYRQSHLEHLLYLGAITGNFGYKHLDNARELGTNTNESCTTGVCNGNKHGHGEHTGYLTLNDSLFSMTSVSDSLSFKNTYDLLFDDSGADRGVNKGQSDGRNRVFRSKRSFGRADKDNYKFAYTWEYPVLKFLSGPSAGDFGSSTGGNTSGGGGNDPDEYVPYTANGIGTKDLASWTFSHIARACWEGEGPYYSTQGAVSIGTNKYRYFRPDGTIYAEVDKSGGIWAYTYPADPNASYDVSDPDSPTQRWNRFKSSWNTDYYMIQSATNKNHDGQEDIYTPSDMSGNASGAGCLIYNEISIPNDKRECASQEEAVFRNFQWGMNEKKMVLVIPMWLYVMAGIAGVCEILPVESCVYQILEGNGITGLSMARKYRDNNVWAKANTSGSSSIPGDFRITILAAPTQTALGLGTIDADKVYNGTIGNGTATPAAVAHNIVALSRLAFPRSATLTLTSNGRSYLTSLLGSQRIDNDGENTDAGFSAWSTSTQGDKVWKKRNSLIPILVALIANLHIKSSESNNAVAKMLAGLQPLVKPLVFFNYDLSDITDVAGVAKNCWLPRIKGVSGYRYPHSAELLPDCNVSGFVDSTSGSGSEKGWYGGDAARNYYSPADKPTFLSVLIDSNTAQDRAEKYQPANTIYRSADGLLAKLTEYTDSDPSTPTLLDRPSVNETLAAPDPVNMDAVNSFLEGLEQLTSGMKMARSKAIQIYEDMSNSGGTIGIATKQVDPPEWIFTKRVRPNDPGTYVDLDLDEILNKVVGGADGTDMTKGLNQFHGAYDTGALVWNDLTDTVTDLNDLLNKFVVQGAPYGISEYLFDILDVVARHNPTPEQIKGFLYTLGKMLAYYDTSASTWKLQGESGFTTLYDLTLIPNVDNVMSQYAFSNGMTKGAVYRALLHSMQMASKDGGLIPFIFDSVSIAPYSSGDLINDLYLWLNSSLISGSNTQFYYLMAELLNSMAEVVSQCPTGVQLYEIYDHYGFQSNDY